jgi:hypothetical protein
MRSQFDSTIAVSIYGCLFKPRVRELMFQSMTGDTMTQSRDSSSHGYDPTSLNT